MSFALIEVEATAKKSARGAGYSWGMAEEAAKATRWLCGVGIDGVGALARILESADGSDLAARAPVGLQGDWHATSDEMCPLMAGAALSDSATVWEEDVLHIDNVLAPIMLLPFASLAARQLGGNVTIYWDGMHAVTDGPGACLSSGNKGKLFAKVRHISIRSGGKLVDLQPDTSRARPADADWAVLNRFAHRTYAPATEESRQKGAGAGLLDND